MLGGFHAQHPRTTDVIGPRGSRLTLLVLLPKTAAHDFPDDRAVVRWEFDGGRVEQRA